MKRTIQDYYETPEDSVRIDTAKAIGKFLSRSGKSDSESKVTISLADEDFAKTAEKFLKAEELYTGKIDGIMGYATVVALQKFLNLKF